MPTAFEQGMSSHLPRVWCNPMKFPCHRNVSPDEICWFDTGESGKVSPKLALAGYIRMKCQVVFNNEHSLHM